MRKRVLNPCKVPATAGTFLSNIKAVMEVGDTMTGKGIVNLIDKLQEEGMSAEKIIEIIKYIETAEPQKAASE